MKHHTRNKHTIFIKKYVKVLESSDPRVGSLRQRLRICRSHWKGWNYYGQEERDRSIVFVKVVGARERPGGWELV